MNPGRPIRQCSGTLGDQHPRLKDDRKKQTNRVCALVSVLILLCSSASSQSALDLFHRMQQALGGADKIAAIRDFDETVQADTWSAAGTPLAPVTKRVRWVKPNDLRIDQLGAPGNTYVLFFDGSSGWEILPNGTEATLADGELKFAQHYLWAFDLNIWVADRNPKYLISSAGPNIVSVADKDDPSQKVELTLDPSTFMPIKSASISLSNPTHPVNQEMRFEAWETISGVKFPQRASNYHDGARLATITIKNAAINRGVRPNDIASKPPDSKPVMQ